MKPLTEITGKFSKITSKIRFRKSLDKKQKLLLVVADILATLYVIFELTKLLSHLYR